MRSERLHKVFRLLVLRMLGLGRPASLGEDVATQPASAIHKSSRVCHRSVSPTEQTRVHLRVENVCQVHLPLSTCTLMIDKANVRKTALWYVFEYCTSIYRIAQTGH